MESFLKHDDGKLITNFPVSIGILLDNESTIMLKRTSLNHGIKIETDNFFVAITDIYGNYNDKNEFLSQLSEEYTIKFVGLYLPNNYFIFNIEDRYCVSDKDSNIKELTDIEKIEENTEIILKGNLVIKIIKFEYERINSLSLNCVIIRVDKNTLNNKSLLEKLKILSRNIENLDFIYISSEFEYKELYDLIIDKNIPLSDIIIYKNMRDELLEMFDVMLKLINRFNVINFYSEEKVDENICNIFNIRLTNYDAVSQ